MKSEKEGPTVKVHYEKPTAVDLGPTAPIVGASCASGDLYSPGGHCDIVGNSATGHCSGTGSSPGGYCVPTGSDGSPPPP